MFVLPRKIQESVEVRGAGGCERLDRQSTSVEISAPVALESVLCTDDLKLHHRVGRITNLRTAPGGAGSGASRLAVHYPSEIG